MNLTQGKSTITGQRLYFDEQGFKYPSISTLAGKFWSTYGIFKWRVKLGRAIAADMEDGHLLDDKQLARLGYAESEKIKND